MLSPVKVDETTQGATIVVMDITDKRLQEEMRREFSSNVSHELKTPLTSISGFAELLKNDLVAQKDVSEIGSNIYDEAQRLIVMIEDILKLSRLDDSQNMGDKEEVDLKQMSEKICAQFFSKAQERNISLEVKNSACLKTIPQLASEIISNLVSNAIKYNEEGGKVEISFRDDDKTVTIQVKDTGQGIALEDQKRIFERFYRADKAHTSEIPGTGLGLSIVKHAASYLGGEVSVVSEPNKGSTFRVILPKKAK